MGITMECGHPPTTWVMEHVELPIGKTNTPPRKEIIIALINKIATSVHLQHSNICFESILTIKYERIVHIPSMMQSPIPKK